MLRQGGYEPIGPIPTLIACHIGSTDRGEEVHFRSKEAQQGNLKDGAQGTGQVGQELGQGDR